MQSAQEQQHSDSITDDMMRLPEHQRVIFAFKVGYEPNLPLEFVFWHVNLLVLFKEVLNIAPRMNIIQSGDCRCYLSIKLFWLKLLEVVVVQNLNHATAEASASFNHLNLEDTAQHRLITMVEEQCRHNVAAVGCLIVKRIKVDTV